MITDTYRVPCPSCSKTMDLSCWPQCFDCREKEHRAHCLENDLCQACGKARDSDGDCPRCYTCPDCEDALFQGDAVQKSIGTFICPQCAKNLIPCAHCGDLHKHDDLDWIETHPGSMEVPPDVDGFCSTCSGDDS